MSSNYPKNEYGTLTFSEDGKRVYGDARLVLQFQHHLAMLRNSTKHLEHTRKNAATKGGVA